LPIRASPFSFKANPERKGVRGARDPSKQRAPRQAVHCARVRIDSGTHLIETELFGHPLGSERSASRSVSSRRGGATLFLGPTHYPLPAPPSPSPGYRTCRSRCKRNLLARAQRSDSRQDRRRRSSQSVRRAIPSAGTRVRSPSVEVSARRFRSGALLTDCSCEFRIVLPAAARDASTTSTILPAVSSRKPGHSGGNCESRVRALDNGGARSSCGSTALAPATSASCATCRPHCESRSAMRWSRGLARLTCVAALERVARPARAVSSDAARFPAPGF
jgi:hypothetical protein